MPILTRRGYTGRFRQNQAFGRPFRMKKHSPQARGLVGWWPTLGGGGVGKLLNYTKNGLNGLPQGTPSIIRLSQVGTAYEYIIADGDHFRITDDGTFDAIDYITVSAWVRLDTVGLNYPFIISAGSHDPFELRLFGTTDRPNFVVQTNLDNKNAIDPNPLTVGKLAYLVGTYDGAAIRIYTDGVETHSASLSGTVNPFDTQAYLAIGTRSTGGSWSGIIGDFRIHNVALSPSEVWHAYTQPWDLYETIPRVFPVVLPAAAARRIFITHV